ncbi:16S rRNA (guanine(966)-N(2))-methyltransferase RsmD [Marinomonas sp. THO17]|uniref:16S rRNA (guanine(966)-N(2))-methyltransferase RsmD n=1 Tax=Marinomonas sp. THO17 TaxID=3149048 RepID=UPI00336BD752
MTKRPSSKHNSVKNKHNSGKSKTAKLRIIGGEWRSRQLPIPDLEGLRPTPDHVRETLFNWLSPHVPGAVCADLFCGSGALGLEALSRGAKHVTFVDSALPVTKQMLNNLTTLQTHQGQVITQGAESYLQQSPQNKFDLVFLDPPFRKGWLEKIIPLLQNDWLAERALVYIEMEKESSLPELPVHWQLKKEKTAGQLTYRLFEVICPPMKT